MTEAQPLSSVTGSSVLLVDAATDEREMYATALGQQGFLIRQAGSSAEALAEIRTHRPDAIVMDVCLPVVSGLDLLRLVRHDRDTQDIPVIILSGYAGTIGEMSEATTLGAAAVRVKPLLPEVLARDIAEIIDKSRKLRAASGEMRMRSVELRERADRMLTRSAKLRKRFGN